MPGLRLGSPSRPVPMKKPRSGEACRRDVADARGDGMTEEEVARFALQLREAERIRAMMAEEKEDTLANGGLAAGQA